MFPVSRSIDRYETTFDHDGLVANAGLIVIATLMSRLGLERLVNRWVHTGSFAPGRKICTLIAAMVAGHPRRSARSCVRSRSGSCANSTLLLAGCWRTRGLRVPAPATPIWSSMWTPRCVRCTAITSTAPRTATRNVSAITPSWRHVPGPGRSCSHGCGKAQPDHRSRDVNQTGGRPTTTRLPPEQDRGSPPNFDNKRDILTACGAVVSRGRARRE